jgi:hypothetical protein
MLAARITSVTRGSPQHCWGNRPRYVWFDETGEGRNLYAAFPHPRGTIEVRWERRAGKTVLDVKAPKGVRVLRT